MKYLKSYNIFEGFSQDFYIGINSIESKYESELEKFRQDAKSEVDQFMFDLTDPYSNIKTTQNHFIENDDPSLWYFLKCDWKDIDEFISLLEETSQRIKEQLDLGFKLSGELFSNKWDGKHDIEHGFVISIDKLKKWIDLIKNHKDGGGYDWLEIKVNIV